jgi:MFS family permease
MSTSRSASIILPILASSAYVLELSFVPLVLPSMADALGLSNREIAGVFNSYMVAVAVAVLVGGWAGDRFDTKSVFSLGVVSFVAGSLIVAFSSSISALLFGRFLQGAGGGLFSPLIPVLLKQAAKGRPGRLLILWGSVSGLLAAIIPIATNLMVDAVDWSLIFLLLAVVAAPAVVLTFFRSTSDITEKPRFQFRVSLFQPIKVWALYGYVFLSFGLIMLYVFLMPMTLDQAGYSLMQTAYAMSAFWFAFTVSGVLLRDQVDTAKIWLILAIAPLFIGAGFLVFVLPLSFQSVAIFSAFIGIGFACCNATSTTLILQYCKPNSESVAASLDISIARVGAVAAVALIAPLSPSYLASAYIIISVLAVALGLAPLLIDRMQESKNA